MYANDNALAVSTSDHKNSLLSYNNLCLLEEFENMSISVLN